MTIEYIRQITTIGCNNLCSIGVRLEANQKKRNELRNDMECEIESLKEQIAELQYHLKLLDQDDRTATKIERTMESAKAKIESAYHKAKTSGCIADIAIRVASTIDTTYRSATSAVEELEGTVQEIRHKAY